MEVRRGVEVRCGGEEVRCEGEEVRDWRTFLPPPWMPEMVELSTMISQASQLKLCTA